MKKTLTDRVVLCCDAEFKSFLDRLQLFYGVRGMSATIRLAVINEARRAGKEVKNNLELREAIADYVKKMGLNTTPENVVLRKNNGIFDISCAASYPKAVK